MVAARQAKATPVSGLRGEALRLTADGECGSAPWLRPLAIYLCVSLQCRRARQNECSGERRDCAHSPCEARSAMLASHARRSAFPELARQWDRYTIASDGPRSHRLVSGDAGTTHTRLQALRQRQQRLSLDRRAAHSSPAARDVLRSDSWHADSPLQAMREARRCALPTPMACSSSRMGQASGCSTPLLLLLAPVRLVSRRRYASLAGRRRPRRQPGQRPPLASTTTSARRRAGWTGQMPATAQLRGRCEVRPLLTRVYPPRGFQARLPASACWSGTGSHILCRRSAATPTLSPLAADMQV